MTGLREIPSKEGAAHEIVVLQHISVSISFSEHLGIPCQPAVPQISRAALDKQWKSHSSGLGQDKDQLAGNLPHGHQRMLGVAVALATNPDLILMDEPVTGMNTEETDKMINKIREIQKRG